MPKKRPKAGQLVDADTGLVLSKSALLATDPVTLFIGAMGRGLPTGAALGLFPCDWVHTFFVPHPLDLAYCDADGRILHFLPAALPNRLLPRIRGAKTVWETPAGTLSPFVAVGGRLEFRPGHLRAYPNKASSPHATEDALLG